MFYVSGEQKNELFPTASKVKYVSEVRLPPASIFVGLLSSSITFTNLSNHCFRDYFNVINFIHQEMCKLVFSSVLIDFYGKLAKSYLTALPAVSLQEIYRCTSLVMLCYSCNNNYVMNSSHLHYFCVVRDEKRERKRENLMHYQQYTCN